MPMLVGVIIGVVLVALVAAVTFFILRRRRRRRPQPAIDPFDVNSPPSPVPQIQGQPLDLAGSRQGSIRSVEGRLPRKISPFWIFSNSNSNSNSSAVRKSSQPQSRTSLLEKEASTPTDSDETRTRDDLAASRVIDRLRDGSLPSSSGGSNNLSEADVTRIALRVAALIGREDTRSVSEPPPEYGRQP